MSPWQSFIFHSFFAWKTQQITAVQQPGSYIGGQVLSILSLVGNWTHTPRWQPVIRCQTWFIYLFGVLRRFQHCTGHITTGSWKGGGNQYIQFVKVLYCKLPTNGKQLPAFPLEAVPGTEPRPQGWEASVTTQGHLRIRAKLPSEAIYKHTNVIHNYTQNHVSIESIYKSI